MEIHVVEDGDQIRIYREHPELPRNIQVEVDYDIQCPTRISLQLGTLNGKIGVREIEGEIEGLTTNGNVDVSAARGPLYLATANGDIDVEVEDLAARGHFTTTNGNISVEKN